LVLDAYKSIKTGEFYQVEHFAAMSLLLGYGTYSEKVNLVASHIDEDLVGVAPRSKFESLLDSMMYVVLDIIP
jgi:hypothetical protein